MFEHPSKEVAKILRTLAKNSNLKASVTCKVFAGGNSVDVKITDGKDTDVNTFQRFAEQYGLKRNWTGMDLEHEVVNFRDDIPQTCWLHIYDKRNKTAN